MSARREVRLERLLGKLVVDAAGIPFGRIEDVVAQPDGDEYLVTHALIGPESRLARMLTFAHQLPTLRALGLGRKPRLRRVPWSWLDLEDVERPRLRESVVEEGGLAGGRPGERETTRGESP
jgi:sporulation protein YlmC with PRC-barrel domain